MMTEAKAEAYWEVLKPYPIELVERACREAIRTSEFMPKPAALIKLIETAPADQALLAWGRVKGALSAVGQYQSVDFNDSILHRVIVHFGGWAAFADQIYTADGKESFLQRDFCKLYEVMARVDGPAPLHLPGMHEQSNQRLGANAPTVSVCMIGPGGEPCGVRHESQKAISSGLPQERITREQIAAAKERFAITDGSKPITQRDVEAEAQADDRPDQGPAS
jgi:Domain of unknown function (DUF6475)